MIILLKYVGNLQIRLNKNKFLESLISYALKSDKKGSKDHIPGPETKYPKY
jgi:hypothetical protein